MQWLGEEPSIELRLDAAATLASHQKARDIVALCHQGAAILFHALAGRSLAVEFLALLCRQRMVRDDDPASTPEGRPPAAMGLPILIHVDRARGLALDGLDPIGYLRGLSGQSVDTDVERSAGSGERSALQRQIRALKQIAEGIETVRIGVFGDHVLDVVVLHVLGEDAAISDGEIPQNPTVPFEPHVLSDLIDRGSRRVVFAVVDTLPELRSGTDSDRLPGVDLNMIDRPVGVGPDTESDTVGVDANGAGFQVERLPERFARDEGVGVKGHAQPPRLEEVSVVGEGVVLRQQQEEVTILDCVHTGSDISVAQRHLPRVMLRGTLPDDIVALDRRCRDTGAPCGVQKKYHCQTHPYPLSQRPRHFHRFLSNPASRCSDACTLDHQRPCRNSNPLSQTALAPSVSAM